MNPNNIESNPIDFVQKEVNNPFTKGFKPFEQLIQEGDYTTFITQNPLSAYSKDLVLNGQFDSGLSNWAQVTRSAATSWTNSGTIYKANALLNPGLKETHLLYQVLNKGTTSPKNAVLSLDWCSDRLGAILTITSVDAYGNETSVVDQIAYNTGSGHYQKMVDISAVVGIGFRVENAGLTAVSNLITLDNVSLIVVDNPFKLMAINSNDELIHDFGKDFKILLQNNIVYTFFKIKWINQYITYNQLLRCYLDEVYLGINQVLDTGFGMDSFTSPWTQTVLGGTIDFQALNSQNQYGLRLTSNGTGRPCGLNQDNKLSPGARYRIRIRLSDDSRAGTDFGIKIQLGDKLSPLLNNNQEYVFEMDCGHLNRNIAILLQSSPLDNGQYLFITELEITPILKEERKSGLFYFKKTHPFTCLIKYRSAKAIEDQIFFEDEYYYIRLESDCCHPYFIHENKYIISVKGKKVLVGVNTIKKWEWIIAQFPEYILGVIGIISQCDDVQIQLPNKIDFVPLQVTDSSIKPMYRQTSVFSPLVLEVELG